MNRTAYLQCLALDKRISAFSAAMRVLENSPENFISPEIINCLCTNDKVSGEKIPTKELTMILNYAKSTLQMKIEELKDQFEQVK